MSILSSLKSAAKKVVNKVKSAFTATTQVANVGGVLKTVEKKPSLSATVGENMSTSQTNQAYKTLGTYTGNSVGAIPPYATSSKGYSSPAGPSLPVKISASSQKVGSSSGSSSTGTSSLSPTTSYASFGASVPTTISARSLASSGSGSGTLTGSGGGGYTLASAPTSVNPGKTDTTGLAGSLSEYYTRNDDGTFEQVKDEANAELEGKANLYKKYMGEPTDVYDDPEIKRAQRERKQIQQALLAPTAELNAVIAQQNTDLLNLRKQGAVEGVTETVYGQQENAINYNAAIRALPLKAHVASLQNDLELAQSYLTELTTMKKEQIKSQHDYNSGLFNVVYSSLEASEKRQADKLIKENDRQYKQEDELIDYKAELLSMAYSQKAPAQIVTAIERATDKVSAAKAAGKYATKAETVSSGSNQSTDNERALMTQFRNEPIVKDFNTILVQKGTIDNYIQNGVGGPADLALVFSFMKGLDPNSVVRETEYANAAKSGNLFQGAFAKFNGYFKEKGGILPANVRSEFQNLVNQKLAVQQRAYENLASQYTDISTRQGLNPKNVVIDYASGGQTGSTGSTTASPEVEALRNKYDY
jgi:hypothetical protein